MSSDKAQTLQTSFKRPSQHNKQSASTPLADEEAVSTTYDEIEKLRHGLKLAEIARDEYLHELDRVKKSLAALQADHVRLEEDLQKKDLLAQEKDADLRGAMNELRSLERTADYDKERFLSERAHLAQKHEEMSETIQKLHQRSASMSPKVAKVSETSSLTYARAETDGKLLNLNIHHVAQERRIKELESRLEELEQDLKEVHDHESTHPFQDQIRALQEENQLLKEEIESYQTLLADQTFSGDFAHSHFMQSTSSIGKYQSIRAGSKVQDLASELEAVAESNSIEDADRKELEEEVLKLQETNKALTLYINTIVSRMLNTEGFEHLLAKDAGEVPSQSLPTNKNKSESGDSLFSRTRSVFSRKSSQTAEAATIADDTKGRPTSDLSTSNTKTTSVSSAKLSSPAHSVVESANHSGRQEASPSRNKITQSGDLKTSKGLRPLQSAVAADQISTRDARRLSVQYSAGSLQEQLEARKNAAETDKQRRSSWMGWLGSGNAKDAASQNAESS